MDHKQAVWLAVAICFLGFGVGGHAGLVVGYAIAAALLIYM